MPSLPITVIASLAEFPSLGESLRFQLTGLAVVFIALGSIWAVMEIVGAWFKRQPQAVASSLPAPAAPSAEGCIDPATLAIIAAAVHVTVGGPYRVHAITAADHPVDWAREGRRHHFASHQVR